MTPERLEEIRADRWGGVVWELLIYVGQLRAELDFKSALLIHSAAVADAELALAEQTRDVAIRAANKLIAERDERASTGPITGPIPDDAKTTDYCTVCGESPNSGSHIFGHTYQRPVTAE